MCVCARASDTAQVIELYHCFQLEISRLEFTILNPQCFAFATVDGSKLKFESEDLSLFYLDDLWEHGLPRKIYVYAA